MPPETTENAESPALPEKVSDSLPLSIVIPAHNEAENICALLDLIASENYPCEIIVSNSGSTDQTAQVVKEYIQAHPDRDIKLVESQLGVSHARNDGANAAQNDHILFLDADVKFRPGFFIRIVNNFQTRNLDAAGFDIEPDSDLLIDQIMFETQNKLQGVLQHIPNYVICTGLAMMVKKKFHQEEIGGFETARHVHEDAVWGQEAARKGRFGIIKERVIFNINRLRRHGRIGFAILHTRNALSVWLKGKPSRQMIEEYNHDRNGNKFR